MSPGTGIGAFALPDRRVAVRRSVPSACDKPSWLMNGRPRDLRAVYRTGGPEDRQQPGNALAVDQLAPATQTSTPAGAAYMWGRAHAGATGAVDSRAQSTSSLLATRSTQKPRAIGPRLRHCPDLPDFAVYGQSRPRFKITGSRGPREPQASAAPGSSPSAATTAWAPSLRNPTPAHAERPAGRCRPSV